MRDIALRCPACESDLQVLTCTACGRVYELRDGVPILVVHDAGEHAAAQARWFDEAVDPEWEIERPHGSPRFHRWLLAEKFRRSVTGLDLRGTSVLAVCAGSGMDAEFLARAGATVVAADISSGAAARTAERVRRFDLHVIPVVADVERLPFADRSVDVVYVHDGLHHLEDPIAGLREMARVARRAVCVSEPAQAAVTRAAVRAGIALEREEAGNRVARLTSADVVRVLAKDGFRVVRAERYGMFYRHEPGWPSRVLSSPGLFQLAKLGFRAANAVFGRFGNKLAVVAVRP